MTSQLGTAGRSVLCSCVAASRAATALRQLCRTLLYQIEPDIRVCSLRRCEQDGYGAASTLNVPNKNPTALDVQVAIAPCHRSPHRIPDNSTRLLVLIKPPLNSLLLRIVRKYDGVHGWDSKVRVAIVPLP